MIYQVRPGADGRYVVRGRRGTGSVVSAHDTREDAERAAAYLNGIADKRDEMRRDERARTEVVQAAEAIVRTAAASASKPATKRCPGCGMPIRGTECPECSYMGQ